MTLRRESAYASAFAASSVSASTEAMTLRRTSIREPHIRMCGSLSLHGSNDLEADDDAYMGTDAVQSQPPRKQ